MILRLLFSDPEDYGNVIFLASSSCLCRVGLELIDNLEIFGLRSGVHVGLDYSRQEVVFSFFFSSNNIVMVAEVTKQK